MLQAHIFIQFCWSSLKPRGHLVIFHLRLTTDSIKLSVTVTVFIVEIEYSYKMISVFVLPLFHLMFFSDSSY